MSDEDSDKKKSSFDDDDEDDDFLENDETSIAIGENVSLVVSENALGDYPVTVMKQDGVEQDVPMKYELPQVDLYDTQVESIRKACSRISAKTPYTFMPEDEEMYTRTVFVGCICLMCFGCIFLIFFCIGGLVIRVDYTGGVVILCVSVIIVFCFCCVCLGYHVLNSVKAGWPIYEDEVRHAQRVTKRRITRIYDKYAVARKEGRFNFIVHGVGKQEYEREIVTDEEDDWGEPKVVIEKVINEYHRRGVFPADYCRDFSGDGTPLEEVMAESQADMVNVRFYYCYFYESDEYCKDVMEILDNRILNLGKKEDWKHIPITKQENIPVEFKVDDGKDEFRFGEKVYECKGLRVYREQGEPIRLFTKKHAEEFETGCLKFWFFLLVVTGIYPLFYLKILRKREVQNVDFVVIKGLNVLNIFEKRIGGKTLKEAREDGTDKEFFNKLFQVKEEVLDEYGRPKES